MDNNQSKTKSYFWWKDKKFLGLLMLLATASFQVFAFLEVPVLTTLHGYTVGMLLGFYNPLLYVFLAYVSLLLLTNNKFRLPKWIQLKWGTYLIICLSIVFISASSGYYQVKNGWFVIGKDSWLAFGKWMSDFTAKNNAFLPVNTNGGVVGVFLYALFATFTSGIGAFMIAIISILVPLSLLFTGSILGLYRKILRKKTLTKGSKSLINLDGSQNLTNDLDSNAEAELIDDAILVEEVIQPLESNADQLISKNDLSLESNSEQLISTNDLIIDDYFD